jgi:repressor LexA
MVPTVDRESPAALHLEVLRWLSVRVSRGEMPPTAREVAAAAGRKSSRTGQRVLEELEGAGLIERSAAPKNQRRPVRITERGWEAVGEGSVMGRIAAGRGLEAVSSEEAYSLAGELLTSRTGARRYLLRVVGESMVEARIHDGDLVVAEEDPDPPDGSVVVALLAEGEITVKRLYRQNGSVKLKAESADHEDIVVPWGEVEIQGRVVASIHSF